MSLWWIVGLQLQGAYGLPVLRLTESLSTVADHSSPDDLLRGIGNWLLYAQDNTGYSIDQAVGYATPGWVGVRQLRDSGRRAAGCSLHPVATPVLRLVLIVVGTIVGAGAWPYDHPSAYGALWKGFAGRSAAWPRLAQLTAGGRR